MGLLDKKYTKLMPTDEYLTDEVILALAWKKSHEYIRSTNWYVDVFELDRSAIDLERHLNKWLEELKADSFKFQPLTLVPAPKSHPWNFKNIPTNDLPSLLANTPFNSELFSGIRDIWEPVDGEAKALRPLAHISIRDQSLTTMLMMCLANDVETFQGNTETDFDDVHTKKIVNYGNRLYCEYKNGTAFFNWGNSTTYSKYFKDYQKFLDRPNYFGRKSVELKANDESIFEVHLDIAKFFDKVNPNILYSKLLKLVSHKECPIAERLIRQLCSWSWSEGSGEIYKSVCSENDSKIPTGIPQGLVAGGFLANIYLLNFDYEIASLIGKPISNGSDIRIIDFCRYVDDMRIIVSARTSNKSEIKTAICATIDKLLSELDLELNSDKTKVEIFRPYINGISTKLRSVQAHVSGPQSMRGLDEQLGHVEGLIALADNFKTEKHKPSTNPLQSIEDYYMDVRDDTVLRFSANKAHKLLSQKRHLISQEVDSNGNLIPSEWDYLQERFARKFIALWSRDPSLVLLLKKALELFPDPRILDPVVKQLTYVLERPDKPKEQFIARYCLCEIFRHSATTIHGKDSYAFPAHAHHAAYFDKLVNLALDIIDKDEGSNNIIAEQARFLCLVRNESLLDEASSHNNFNVISKIMLGLRNIKEDMSLEEFTINSIFAYQMAMDKSAVIKSINALLNNAPLFLKSYFAVETFIRKIIVESPELFEALEKKARSSSANWIKFAKDVIEASGVKQKLITGDLSRFSGNEPTHIPLLGVLKRDDNPFAHENAALVLIKVLLEKHSEKLSHPVLLATATISCDNWNEIQSLTTKVELNLKTDTVNLFNRLPAWVENDEHKLLYNVGTFLRGVLLGTVLWTNSYLRFSERAQYRGIKSSEYKRQLGMMHSPEALNGDAAPMSGWLTSLLFHLLQWPGLSIKDDNYEWPIEWNIESLKALINNRIESQKCLFCKLSGIPGYVEKIKLPWEPTRQNLNVVMVQSLLPLKSDFGHHGILLDTFQYRARHRRHVAAVAELILHKIYSQRCIGELEDIHFKADLIIWPELSVHQDDIDILKSLSDKTGAMIFTGLTFCHIPKIGGPINTALWLIPQKQRSGRGFLRRLQGKQHMMADEKKIKPWRPYQLFIELEHPAFKGAAGFRLTGSVCYDATDIKISADLKDKSDAYLVVALNRDVNTFDTMIDALHYHMYQPVVLVNTGEFGGSVAKAPYKERHEKLITHTHGANQVSISSFEINMFDFRDVASSFKSGKKVKAKPAG